jgi:cobalt-zinc-cadmium efflux system protein
LCHSPCWPAYTFIGITLNIIFIAIEAFYGWRINSLALRADALVSVRS